LTPRRGSRPPPGYRIEWEAFDLVWYVIVPSRKHFHMLPGDTYQAALELAQFHERDAAGAFDWHKKRAEP